MKIYVSHSQKYDYIKDIYEPIKKSDIYKNNEIFFPHEDNKPAVKTKEIIKNSDLVIAEVSIASVSQGIELGWTDAFNINMVCIYKKGEQRSSSLEFITNNFIEYENSEDMINKINDFIIKMKNSL